MTYLIRLPLASALLAAVVLALAPWSASAAGGCAGADAEPSRATEDQAATATLCLLNAERAERGLGRLGRDDRLAAAAQRHARDMVARSYFAHVSPAGSSPLDRIRTTGYIPSAGRWIVGENLGWGTGRMATPREIVAAWMGSPTHRANVLQGRYREIGLGVLTGNPKRTDAQVCAAHGAPRGQGAASLRRQAAPRLIALSTVDAMPASVPPRS
jgi:uncharacterized protein YkwD